MPLALTHPHCMDLNFPLALAGDMHNTMGSCFPPHGCSKGHNCEYLPG